MTIVKEHMTISLEQILKIQETQKKEPSLNEIFEQKAEFVKQITNLKNEEKLEIYGLFKQVNIGDINIPEPSFWSQTARAKYNAWKSCEGMSKDEARRKYIDKVNEFATRIT